MKKFAYLLLLPILFACASTTEVQNHDTRIAELENVISNLSNEIDLLKSKQQDFYNKKEIDQIVISKGISDEQAINDVIRSVSSSTKSTSTSQCIAITQKGTQCKRNAEVGSNYCWQHKPKVAKESQKIESNSSSGTYNGHSIITGPRGGQYYINKNGNKTYIRKKK